MCVLGSSTFLSSDEMEISFHVEKSTTLAAAVGKSIATAPKIQEFNWSKGKLTKLPDPKTTEKMDTSDIEIILTDPAEFNAQRLVEEGSDFLNYIPESELVRLLRLALRSKFKETGEIKEYFDPDIILNAIFSTSFTDAFLVQFMKKMSLDESMITLEVLLSFLNHKVYNSNISHKNPSDFQPEKGVFLVYQYHMEALLLSKDKKCLRLIKKLDSCISEKLLKWVFLVYQSHMEALLLSKDKKCLRLIKKLDSCISEKIKEYEEYDTIQNLFLVVQKKTNILPEQYMVGQYCIESLDT